MALLPLIVTLASRWLFCLPMIVYGFLLVVDPVRQDIEAGLTADLLHPFLGAVDFSLLQWFIAIIGAAQFMAAMFTGAGSWPDHAPYFLILGVVRHAVTVYLPMYRKGELDEDTAIKLVAFTLAAAMAMLPQHWDERHETLCYSAFCRETDEDEAEIARLYAKYCHPEETAAARAPAPPVFQIRRDVNPATRVLDAPLHTRFGAEDAAVLRQLLRNAEEEVRRLQQQVRLTHETAGDPEEREEESPSLADGQCDLKWLTRLYTRRRALAEQLVGELQKELRRAFRSAEDSQQRLLAEQQASEERVRRAQEQAEGAEADRDAALGRVAHLEGELRELQLKVGLTEQQLAQAAADKVELQKELRSAFHSLEDSQQRLLAEQQASEERVRRAQEQAEGAAADRDAALGRVAHLEGELRELQVTVGLMEQQLAQAATDKVHLQKELRSTFHSGEDSQQRLLAEQQASEERVRRAQELVEGAEADRDAALGRVVHLEGELRGLQLKMGLTEQQLAQAAAGKVELQKELRSAFHSLEDSQQRLLAEQQASEERVRRAQELAEGAEADRDAALGHVAHLEGELRGLQLKVGLMEQQLVQAAADKVELQKELRSAFHSLEDSQQRLLAEQQASEERVRRAQEQAEGAEADRDAASGRVAHLEGELRELQLKVGLTEQQLAQAAADKVELQKELRSAFHSLEDSQQRLLAEQQASEERVRRAQKQAEGAEADRDAAFGHVAHLERELHELQEAIQARDEELRAKALDIAQIEAEYGRVAAALGQAQAALHKKDQQLAGEAASESNLDIENNLLVSSLEDSQRKVQLMEEQLVRAAADKAELEMQVMEAVLSSEDSNRRLLAEQAAGAERVREAWLRAERAEAERAAAAGRAAELEGELQAAHFTRLATETPESSPGRMERRFHHFDHIVRQEEGTETAGGEVLDQETLSFAIPPHVDLDALPAAAEVEELCRQVSGAHDLVCGSAQQYSDASERLMTSERKRLGLQAELRHLTGGRAMEPEDLRAVEEHISEVVALQQRIASSPPHKLQAVVDEFREAATRFSAQSPIGRCLMEFLQGDVPRELSFQDRSGLEGETAASPAEDLGGRWSPERCEQWADHLQRLRDLSRGLQEVEGLCLTLQEEMQGHRSAMGAYDAEMASVKAKLHGLHQRALKAPTRQCLSEWVAQEDAKCRAWHQRLMGEVEKRWEVDMRTRMLEQKLAFRDGIIDRLRADMKEKEDLILELQTAVERSGLKLRPTPGPSPSAENLAGAPEDSSPLFRLTVLEKVRLFEAPGSARSASAPTSAQLRPAGATPDGAAQAGVLTQFTGPTVPVSEHAESRTTLMECRSSLQEPPPSERPLIAFDTCVVFNMESGESLSRLRPADSRTPSPSDSDAEDDGRAATEGDLDVDAEVSSGAESADSGGSGESSLPVGDATPLRSVPASNSRTPQSAASGPPASPPRQPLRPLDANAARRDKSPPPPRSLPLPL